MSLTRRHVLVIGAHQAALDRVAPMLRREEFDVHTVAPSRFVLDLIAGTPFEILILTLPTTRLSMEEMVQAIRREGSSCRTSGVLVLAQPDILEDASRWVDGGVNRVVSLDWPESRIWQALADLLDVAPRVDLRVLLEVDLQVDGYQSALGQTRNVSRSGMLVTTDEPFRVGSRFDFKFFLRGSRDPVEGSGEVVRQTDLGQGLGQGFGARFLSLKASGREALQLYIQRILEADPETGPAARRGR